MGAVSGAQVFLKAVTMPKMRPPMRPPHIQGITAAGFALVRYMFQVQDAVRTVSNKRIPVLFTVPWSVMASPRGTAGARSVKVLALSAGLPLRIISLYLRNARS